MPRRPKPGPARRPRGSWAIDHVPSRTKPWRVRPPASVDPRRPASYHATREAAEAHVAEQRARLDRPPAPATTGDVTLGDYCAFWISQSALSSDWSVATIAAYRTQLSYLGDLYARPLTEITRADLQARVAALRTAGPRLYGPERTTRPLSPRTVAEAAATWRRAFSEAVDDGLLTDNPTRRLRVPKAEQHEAPSWSPGETRRLVAGTRGHRFEVVVALVVGLGLRIGEVLGLAWDDLDWTARTVTIRRSGTQRIVQEHTKGRRVRVLALPSPVWAALLRHREQQFAGAVYVLERVPGKRWTYRSVRLALHAITAEIGIPDYAWHAGRHAVSSYLLAAGASVAEVAALLGHSSPQVTMRLYAHALEDRAATAALAEGLFPTDPAPETGLQGSE